MAGKKKSQPFAFGQAKLKTYLKLFEPALGSQRKRKTTLKSLRDMGHCAIV